MFFNNTISYASQHMTTNSQLNKQLSVVAEFINPEGLKECSSAFSDNFYTFNQCLMDVINSGGHNMSEENGRLLGIGLTLFLILFCATVGYYAIVPAMRIQLHKCCPNCIDEYSKTDIYREAVVSQDEVKRISQGCDIIHVEHGRGGTSAPARSVPMRSAPRSDAGFILGLSTGAFLGMTYSHGHNNDHDHFGGGGDYFGGNGDSCV